MAVTVNASTSSGLVWSADLSGAMQLQTNGTTVASTATNGDFAFNSGYGSAAVAYACRAWVNFNGVTTVSIRGSGNVTSVTRNSTGDYTVNFTTAMPDANYAANTTSTRATLLGSADVTSIISSTAPTTSAYRFLTQTGTGSVVDSIYTTVSIFR